MANSIFYEDSEEREEYMLDNFDLPLVCKYNYGVDCVNNKNCDRCGWSPDGHANRMSRIQAQMRGKSR